MCNKYYTKLPYQLIHPLRKCSWKNKSFDFQNFSKLNIYYNILVLFNLATTSKLRGFLITQKVAMDSIVLSSRISCEMPGNYKILKKICISEIIFYEVFRLLLSTGTVHMHVCMYVMYVLCTIHLYAAYQYRPIDKTLLHMQWGFLKFPYLFL